MAHQEPDLQGIEWDELAGEFTIGCLGARIRTAGSGLLPRQEPQTPFDDLDALHRDLLHLLGRQRSIVRLMSPAADRNGRSEARNKL